MDFTGKTVVITGGGRGIGKAISLLFSQLGANVVINGTKGSTSAEDMANEIVANGGKAVAVKGDVKVLADAEELINTAVKTFGGVDILVNNAGITRDGFIMRSNEDDWDAVLDTNLKGAWSCIKAVSRIMMKQRFGSIINITSVVGIIGNAGQANYAASKAGMIGLTKSVAKEFAPRGIRCNAVAPGFIATDMTASLPDNIKEDYLKGIPLGQFGSPEDVANIVAFLAGESSKYITGQTIRVDGGMNM